MSATHRLKVEVARGTRAWAPPRARMTDWAAAALGRRGERREIAVRVVLPRESRELNKTWRGKDQPTNVLSFPAPEPVSGKNGRRGMPQAEHLPLGDLVICAEVVRRGAARDRKPLVAHWAHMIVHGALHLVGYDHEAGRRERLRMERREISVLRHFGFENPYL